MQDQTQKQKVMQEIMQEVIVMQEIMHVLMLELKNVIQELQNNLRLKRKIFSLPYFLDETYNHFLMIHLINVYIFEL